MPTVSRFASGMSALQINVAGIQATYPPRDIADVGGLMSYGTDTADAWRQTGTLWLAGVGAE